MFESGEGEGACETDGAKGLCVNGICFISTRTKQVVPNFSPYEGFNQTRRKVRRLQCPVQCPVQGSGGGKRGVRLRLATELPAPALEV